MEELELKIKEKVKGDETALLDKEAIAE
jgi:hypothetical protein